jgi:hypothetical protein
MSRSRRRISRQHERCLFAGAHLRFITVGDGAFRKTLRRYGVRLLVQPALLLTIVVPDDLVAIALDEDRRL